MENQLVKSWIMEKGNIIKKIQKILKFSFKVQNRIKFISAFAFFHHYPPKGNLNPTLLCANMLK
jgi:hypothetical protein